MFLNTTSRINCQVGGTFHICVIKAHTNWPRSQGLDITTGRECHLICSGCRVGITQLLFIDECLPEHFLRYAFNSSSYVSNILFLGARTTFPDQALIEIRSIAIWNRKKTITTIAATLWLTNVGVSVWGKSFPPFSYYGVSRMRYQHHVSLGVSRVNTLSPLP